MARLFLRRGDQEIAESYRCAARVEAAEEDPVQATTELAVLGGRDTLSIGIEGQRCAGAIGPDVVCARSHCTGGLPRRERPVRRAALDVVTAVGPDQQV